MRLLIAGAGGHGRVVADAAGRSGQWSRIEFIDDAFPENRQVGVWPIIGTLNNLEALADSNDSFVAAFGDPELRLAQVARAQQCGLKVATVIHPDATVADDVRLGEGTVVFAQGAINIGSVIGRAVIINTGATVDHDCVLADAVHICPGANLAGQVSVGKNTWFGIGSVAKQGIRIGANVTVGAGSVCIRDVSDGITVYGVPAKARNS